MTGSDRLLQAYKHLRHVPFILVQISSYVGKQGMMQILALGQQQLHKNTNFLGQCVQFILVVGVLLVLYTNSGTLWDLYSSLQSHTLLSSTWCVQVSSKDRCRNLAEVQQRCTDTNFLILSCYHFICKHWTCTWLVHMSDANFIRCVCVMGAAGRSCANKLLCKFLGQLTYGLGFDRLQAYSGWLLLADWTTLIIDRVDVYRCFAW